MKKYPTPQVARKKKKLADQKSPHLPPQGLNGQLLNYTLLLTFKLSIPNNRHFNVLLLVLQAKTIGEFVSKFADLQAELETLIQAQRLVINFN